MKNKECIICGSIFIDRTKSLNKKYCCKNCYTKARMIDYYNNKTQKIKICRVCNSEYIDMSLNGKSVCCNNCITEYKKQRNKKYINYSGINHSNYVKNLRSTRKEKGLCRECNKNKMEFSNYCEEHYLKNTSKAAMRTEKYWNELKIMFEKQNGKCYYTGKDLIFGINASIDHIISQHTRLDNVYTLENLVWCDLEINLMKRNISYENFIANCKLILDTVGRASGDVGISRIYEGGTVVSA